MEFENSEYERLLFYCAHKGRKDLATTLLNRGIDPNATILGRNALIGASENGAAELVSELLKFGAELNGSKSEQEGGVASDLEGNTPLMYACGGGFYDIAEMLLKRGADVDVRNKQGSTAFLLSCITGQKNIVKLLLAHGADFRLTNFKGQTPLMLASFYGRAQILKMLLSRTGLDDVNAKDVHEDTALIFAAQRGQQDICQLLIEAGARTSDKNKYNNSAKTYFASAKMEFNKYNDNVATLFRTVYA